MLQEVVGLSKVAQLVPKVALSLCEPLELLQLLGHL